MTQYVDILRKNRQKIDQFEKFYLSRNTKRRMICACPLALGLRWVLGFAMKLFETQLHRHYYFGCVYIFNCQLSAFLIT